MKSISTTFALCLCAATLPAQELIHYKFDEGYGSKVINYAANSPVPAEGTITSTKTGAPAANSVPGRYGFAFAGGIPAAYSLVTTGWNPGTFTGSLSYALWLRAPAGTAAPQNYFFGAFPFRVYTISGVMTTGGLPNSVNTKANVLAMAKLGWVHAALVADNSALTATYYINGVAETPITLTSPVSFTATGFWVGDYAAMHTLPGVYDIDEFVFAARAFSAAEVAALAASPRAADGAYAGGCGGLTLAGTGARPTVGNFLYQLSLSSSYAGAYSVMVGSNRASLGGVPLPFDLSLLIGGIGTCMIDSSLDLFSVGGAKGVGATNVGFPIPNLPAISGLTLYLQAPAFGGPTPLSVSNPFSVGIGN